MGKSSKEQLSKNALFTAVVCLIIYLLGDISGVVKDIRKDQIEDAKSIAKLEVKVDNVEADISGVKANYLRLESRVDGSALRIIKLEDNY